MENEVNPLLQDLSRRGEEWYTKLRPQLEPEHNGKAIAINVETGQYVIDPQWITARRQLRLQNPNGLIYSLFIGPPSEREVNLAGHLTRSAKP